MYKLINKNTEKGIICKKLVIDSFDYYYNDDSFGDNEYYYDTKQKTIRNGSNNHVTGGYKKKIIATNNPNIDIPKVIDEVDNIIKNAFYDKKGDFKRSTIGADDWINGLKLGYNKAKETYQFTEEDIFGLKDLLQNTSPLMFEVVARNYIRNLKETKTIYYE